MNLADHKKITDQNKVENLHVSSEMVKDPSMDQALRAGISKEVNEIEADVRKQTDLPDLEHDPEKKEELFQNIMWALKRKGEWEEEPKAEQKPLDPVEGLSPEDRRALEIGRKIQNQQKHPFRRMLLKHMSRVAIVLIGVFVLSMSTEANRKRVMGVWNGLVNGELRIDIETANDTIPLEIPEQEAYTEIETQLGIVPMKFMTVLDKLKYVNYTVNVQQGNAMLFYQYENEMITIYMYSPNSLMNRNEGFDGNIINTVITNNDKWELDIKEIVMSSGVSGYMTDIIYKEAYYSISGKIPQDIFENMVKEIYF